jgi:hypothetical protein
MDIEGREQLEQNVALVQAVQPAGHAIQEKGN